MRFNVRYAYHFLLAASLLLFPGPGAEAQLFVGAHGSVNELNGAAFGLGGRLGVVLHQTNDLTVALEGVGEYLWPSCDVADCGAVLLHANLVARRGVATFAEVYAGLGFVYESFTIEDPDSQLEKFEGDDVGFSILAGTQSGDPGGVRPFLEVRYTFMRDLQNQAGAALGIRLPIG